MFLNPFILYYDFYQLRLILKIFQFPGIQVEIMEQEGIVSPQSGGNQALNLTDLVPSINEEEAPIDFGIEPTPTLSTVRKPTQPRNLPKKRNKTCCTIL